VGNSFGYVSLYAKEQSIEEQFEALKPYTKNKENLYIDGNNNMNIDRTDFEDMYNKMEKGDTLYLKSIDCLGDNPTHIKKRLEMFKYKRIRIKIIDIPTTLQDIPAGEEWIKDRIENILIEVYSSIYK
jgi:DNA invertase Pin-like site-specific DNA recombinase